MGSSLDFGTEPLFYVPFGPLFFTAPKLAKIRPLYYQENWWKAAFQQFRSYVLLLMLFLFLYGPSRWPPLLSQQEEPVYFLRQLIFSGFNVVFRNHLRAEVLLTLHEGIQFWTGAQARKTAEVHLWGVTLLFKRRTWLSM